MFEIGDTKVFADYEDVEEAAYRQIHNLTFSPVGENQKIAIMSDVHAGAGCVIGFTSTMGDKVVPNLIGVDIGCGMLSVPFSLQSLDCEKLDKYIREKIPSGFSRRSKAIRNISIDLRRSIFEICERTNQDYVSVLKSIGTLGGGNHFIEVGKDKFGMYWLTIHTGSRNFGLKICQYHQKIAKEQNPYGELSFLTGVEKDQYLSDMQVAQQYARLNRIVISRILLLHLVEEQEEFLFQAQKPIESVHNYIDFTDMIVRKGAIRANKDDLVVIPWNMRDGLIIGQGKGNPEWNFSAPHGAGRVMGRGVAKKSLDLEVFKSEMEGVFSTCISENTIDESPMAYKDSALIEKHLSDTVEIIHRVKPVYNFKAN